MVIKQKHIKIISAFFILFLFYVKVDAQQDLTSYYLNALPQSLYNNPALSPDSRFYMGVPGLSSLYFGLSNNLFDTKNVLQKVNGDSISINANNFIKNLQKFNYLNFNFQEEIFAFGFKLKRNYFSFSYSVKGFAILNYAKDIPNLLVNGNYDASIMTTEGKTFDFSQTGANAMVYQEFAIGMSRKLTSKLTAGARVKTLFGVADIQTKKSEGTLYTSSEQTLHNNTINAAFDVNTNVPGLDDNNSKTQASDFVGTKNLGLGLDLGVNYLLNDKISVSASILDLGYIRWKSTPTNYSFTSENVNFSFQGIDPNKVFNLVNNELKEDTVYTKQLKDSLSKIFDTKKTNKAYTTSLPTKIMLSGAYHLTKNDVFGILFRGDILENHLYSSFAMSYNRRLTNIVQASVSYSMRNRDYSNIGIGLVLSLGFFQIYAITDNIFSLTVMNKASLDKGNTQIPYPNSMKNMNVRFGMNIVFGRSKSKE